MAKLQNYTRPTNLLCVHLHYLWKKIPLKQLSYLNKYLYKYRTRFILGVFFVGFSNFFAIFPAQIIREAFDIIIAHLSQTSTLESIKIKDYFFSNLAHQFISRLELPTLLLILGSIILINPIQLKFIGSLSVVLSELFEILLIFLM